MDFGAATIQLISTRFSRYPASTLSTSIGVVSQPSPSRKIGAKMMETGEVSAIRMMIGYDAPDAAVPPAATSTAIR
jgi:hypothetical protein